jgi:hypothetical protein
MQFHDKSKHYFVNKILEYLTISANAVSLGFDYFQYFWHQLIKTYGTKKYQRIYRQRKVRLLH